MSGAQTGKLSIQYNPPLSTGYGCVDTRHVSPPSQHRTLLDFVQCWETGTRYWGQHLHTLRPPPPLSPSLPPSLPLSPSLAPSLSLPAAQRDTVPGAQRYRVLVALHDSELAAQRDDRVRAAKRRRVHAALRGNIMNNKTWEYWQMYVMHRKICTLCRKNAKTRMGSRELVAQCP